MKTILIVGLNFVTHYPQKINVWVGILNDILIGPFFIDGNLNARAYEELLRNQIVPRIRKITGDNFQNIWFQQDGAAAHYGREVRAYLDTFTTSTSLFLGNAKCKRKLLGKNLEKTLKIITTINRAHQ